MRRIVGSGGVTNLGFIRRSGHCCPGNILTTRMLNFINASSGKLSNLRVILSSRLGKNMRRRVMTASGGKGTVFNSMLSGFLPSGNGDMALAVSTAVRFVTRHTLSGTVISAKTGRTDIVIVSPGGNRVLTVTGHPDCSPGGCGRDNRRTFGGVTIAGLCRPNSAFGPVVTSTTLTTNG